MSLKSGLRGNLANLAGWRSKRKIVVIESDDWGSIRMPTKKAFEFLKNSGVDVITGDHLRFNSYDNLATVEDLSALFDVLFSIKDKNGNAAVFTPLSLLANPDFDRIRSSSFSEYFYEPFTDTLKRFPGCRNSYTLWKEGIKERLFVPEFHGREHLNVSAWMKALRRGDKATLLAFEQGSWGFNNEDEHPLKISYLAAFDSEGEEEIGFHKYVLSDGLQLFEKLMGYPATYFVPPNGIFSKELLPEIADKGIKYVFTHKFQREKPGTGKGSYTLHYLGQKNKSGLRYITRNCIFEPSYKSKDWVDSCMKEISIAFKWHKPAIISSHRVNYTGSLNQNNRNRGLHQLKQLLSEIVQSWPDVEFMTSAELGSLILESKTG